MRGFCPLAGIGRVDICTGISTNDPLRNPDRVSWWPPVDVWNACGLESGYWTPEAEEWFASRLQDLSAGTQQALTHSQWRRALTRFSCDDTADIKKANVEFSQRLVDCAIPRPPSP